jgi:hypothetical protein
VIRKSVKAPTAFWAPKKQEGTIIFDSAAPGKRYLRCNEPDIVCSISDPIANSNSIEIKFKYRTEAAPNTKAIYFLLYYDEYCTVLAEIWRVFVHSLQRYL